MSTLPRKEIDQPLGQDRRERRPPRTTPRRRSLLICLAALALIGGSAAIALRDDPFRAPPVTVVTSPDTVRPETPELERQVAAAPAPLRSQPGAAIKEGPSIIKVQPADTPGSIVVVRDPSAVAQDLRTAHLPDRSLLETSEFGPLPVRGADGRRPFDVYARPWSGARGARVAIVLGGVGLSQTGTKEAIDRLPGEVTLAFAPYGNSLDRWMQAARRKGHELVMQVPLEPFDFPTVNPGRNTLTLAAGAEENVANLRWALARMTNYTGVMNYMGARFIGDRDAMGPVMEELGRRGLLFLDDGSTARSVAAETALASRVPYAASDVLIDAVRERAAILAKLDELERIARAKGFAIGTGSAFDVTVDAVSGWVGEARKRGIEIVPISAVAVDSEQG